MSYLPRDGQQTVIQVDTDTIRAARGIGELFARPSVTIPACYAVPRNTQISDEANGETNGESSQSAAKHSWLAGQQLVQARNEAGFDHNWEVKWPFRPSKAIDDWSGREFLFLHVYQLLEIRLSNNLSSLLLMPPSFPPSLPLPTQALYTQLAFEKLNVPAFSIVPTPLAGLLALGATTGIALHVGPATSEITIVVDSIVRWECSTTAEVGWTDCEQWFEGQLLQDASLDKELSLAVGRGDEPWGPGDKEKLVKEVAHFVWTECTGDDIEVQTATGKKLQIAAGEAADEESFDVAKKLVGDPAGAAAASHKSKKAQAAQAAQVAKAGAAAAAAAAQAVAEDVIIVTIPSLPGKEVSLGAVRHRLMEPLFRGKMPGGDTVWEAMGRAVESPALSQYERMSLWEGVAVIGDLARFKSFGPALTTYLLPFLLSSPEVPSDSQPAKTRLLLIPDYFANFKGATTDLAPFLGGSLASKTTLSDPSMCVTKVDYNARGPAAIYTVVAGEDR